MCVLDIYIKINKTNEWPKMNPFTFILFYEFIIVSITKACDFFFTGDFYLSLAPNPKLVLIFNYYLMSKYFKNYTFQK